MRVLVCGGRDFNDVSLLNETLATIDVPYRPIATIIHGDARGADTLAGQWAREHKKFEWKFPADWEKYGKSAGPIRNSEMLAASTPDLVIAFPGGRGTQDMIDRATKSGYHVLEITSDGKIKT